MHDPLSLPFDTDEMVAGLRPWIETESPTYDPVAVNRMLDIAQSDLAALGATLERIPGHGGIGDSVRAHLPHPRQGEGGVLVMGHFDTVHPVGTLAVNPFRREGGLCYGPGIMDMKGGNYVYLDAIRKILAAGIETPLPVTVLFTPDEEIGTPLARGVIEAEARRHDYVLVPEPARLDGGAVIGRYAIQRFDLQTRGRPSHAGWLLSEGRSAIALMAKKVAEIEGMTTDDITFSLGVIHAGQWVNCVSSVCDAKVLSVAKTDEMLAQCIQMMKDHEIHEGDVTLTVTPTVTRPVWRHDQPGDQALLEIAQGITRKIGFELEAAPSGGGSDGNFTGAMGIPTLDSIGVRGRDLHTQNEHIFEDSLVERAKLAAGLLCKLGA